MTVTDHELDDMLFRFHCEATEKTVTPTLVARWTAAYPHYAEDIREHAVELLDMSFRASANEAATSAGRSPARLEAVTVSIPEMTSGTAPSTLREALRTVGLTLRDFADGIDIARSIVTDVNDGEIVKETIPRRFLRIGAARAGTATDWFKTVVMATNDKGERPAFKSTGDPLPGRQRTWEEAIRDTDMDEDRMAFWLSDEG
ncbi:hypothetical protein [Methylobacterium sp. WL116]|uniref:hypothetical protein n=1 Tax=Methylobacterium sp. WL116 TaxID=2603889 RepID=UPI0011C87620|nr:hypothetical protein [Methylobacterium sp. WL116]TXM95585.1 hypothetical protein FV223_00530 [Methylobacterium sp. WL116]